MRRPWAAVCFTEPGREFSNKKAVVPFLDSYSASTRPVLINLMDSVKTGHLQGFVDQ